MTAVARPSGLGPSTDPGDLGWYAQGLGVDLPGGLGLLGNYSAAQRNQMLHAQDPAAGLDAGTMGATAANNQAALNNANSYLASLESGQASGGDENRMLSAMNAWQRAAWTGQGDPGNYMRVGNTLVPRYTEAQLSANPNLVSAATRNSGGAPVTNLASGNPGGAANPGGVHSLAISAAAPGASIPTASSPPGAAPNVSTAAGGSGGGSGGASGGSAGPSYGADTVEHSITTTANTGANMPNTAFPLNTSGPDTMSGTGDIVGSSANYWDPAYGGVPVVPDPVSSQYQSIAGNQSNLGGIEQLAGGINAFGAQQARGQYQANLPGYDRMTSQASNDIIAELEGQVPQDVINNLQQSAAERGIATGSPMGPNASAQYLKSLGLTSLGQKQLGQQNLTAAIQRTPTSPLFNVASMMVSPTDEQAARMAANLYASAPDPRAAAMEAMARARQGLGAGAGGGGSLSVNPAGIAPAAGLFPSTQTPPFTSYPTTTYGGTGNPLTGGGGAPAGNPYTNWQNWYNQLGTGQTGTGAGAYDPYGFLNDGGQAPWEGSDFGDPLGIYGDEGDSWIDRGTGEDQYGLMYDEAGGAYDPYYGE